jgi:hypothetical protein
MGTQDSSGCSTFAKEPVKMTFVKLAARAYSRTCLVPELADSMTELAVVATLPFTKRGKFDRITALTSIMNNELGISMV